MREMDGRIFFKHILSKPNKSIIKRKVLKYWPRNSINTDDKILNKILETQA
jgi:hypothetical protein